MPHNIVNVPLTPMWRNAGKAPLASGRGGGGRGSLSSPRLCGCGRLEWRQAFAGRVVPALRAFGPDLILLSAGFDGADGDQGNLRGDQSGLDLHPEDFLWLTQELVPAFARCPTFPAAN